jgi:hypothetical protein
MNNLKYVNIKKRLPYGFSTYDCNDSSIKKLAYYLTEIYLKEIPVIIMALRENDNYYNFWRNEMYVDYYADDYYVIGDPAVGCYNGYDPVPEGMLWIKRDQFVKILQRWYELRSKGITEIMITKDGDNFEMHEVV